MLVELMHLHEQMIRTHAQARRHQLPDDLDARLAELTSGLRHTGAILADRLRGKALPPVAAGWSSLTVAELAVIRLVAAGRTNRQAADAL